jgi:hypothetical protein
MRVLIAIVLAAMLGWGGYWFVGSAALDAKINAWFSAEESAGADVGNSAVSIEGFPSRFDVTVTNPHAQDRVTGWGWKAPFVQVLSMTWKPWHLIAALPHEQQIEAPDGETLTLRSDRLMGSLLLHPGLSLALNQAVLEGEKLALSSADGWRWTAQKLVVAAAEDKSWKNGLRLGWQATALVPDAAVAAQVPDLGPVISDSHVDATLQLTAPVDRKFASAGAHVTAVHLRDARLTWGPLVVSAKGSLARGGDGRAEGTLAVTITDWRRLPDALVALGLIQPSARGFAVRALKVLGEAAGNPEALELPLAMHGGRMTLGHLPLGPAPMLP